VKRQVEHRQHGTTGRVCSCGARFKTQRDLRHHVEAKNGGQELWLPALKHKDDHPRVRR
jgi:hypothetical protein